MTNWTLLVLLGIYSSPLIKTHIFKFPLTILFPVETTENILHVCGIPAHSSFPKDFRVLSVDLHKHDLCLLVDKANIMWTTPMSQNQTIFFFPKNHHLTYCSSVYQYQALHIRQKTLLGMVTTEVYSNSLYSKYIRKKQIPTELKNKNEVVRSRLRKEQKNFKRFWSLTPTK